MSRPHLYLIGYRGSGKSSVGRALAESLARPFVDTDVLIEEMAGKSISEIFGSVGESGFRELESRCILSLQELPPSVIALGGGSVLRPSNRTSIRQFGRCVWLRASCALLAERISSDPNTAARRPQLSALGTVSEIENLLAQREPLYSEMGEFIVDTDHRSIGEISQQIISWYARVCEVIELSGADEQNET